MSQVAPLVCATMANGLMTIYKRLEQGGFTWPAVRDGVMRLSKAQFAALFEGDRPVRPAAQATAFAA